MAVVKFIHIGDFKTGTTWLQRNVFLNDPRIRLLGEGASDVAVQEWAALEALSYEAEPDLQEWAARFSVFTDKASEGGDKLVGVSRESLIDPDYLYFSGYRTMAHRLQETFGDTKIICVFRNQTELLPSLYSTYIKNGGINSYQDIFGSEQRLENLRKRLCYDRVVDVYCQLFGRENCLFMLFDELAADPESFLSRLYGFIGLEHPPKAIRPGQPNRRLSRAGLALNRVLNKFIRSSYNDQPFFPGLDLLAGALYSTLFPRKATVLCNRMAFLQENDRNSTRFRHVGSKIVVAAIRAFCEKLAWGPPARSPALPDILLETIATSNQVLADKYDLPTNRYGWPMAERIKSGNTR